MAKTQKQTLLDFLKSIPNPKTITSLTILDAITRLPHGALAGFNSLKEIYLPKTLVSLNLYFDNTCYQLETIHVHPKNEIYSSVNGVVYNKAMTRLVRCPPGRGGTLDIPEGVSTIGKTAFHHVSILRELHLPKTIKKLEDGCFALCENLESMVLPETIKTIPYKAFFHCLGLEMVALPGKLRTIDEEAFLHCRNLSILTIPITVKHIGKHAFEACHRLKLHAAHDEKPKGWATDWNPDQRPVQWASKGGRQKH